MKSKSYKRILAWILSMAMIISSISFSAYAEEETSETIDPWQMVEDLRESWDEQEQEYLDSLEAEEETAEAEGDAEAEEEPANDEAVEEPSDDAAAEEPAAEEEAAGDAGAVSQEEIAEPEFAEEEPEEKPYPSKATPPWKTTFMGEGPTAQYTRIEENDTTPTTVYVASTGSSAGKLSSGSDGIVYYYQELGKDESFVLTTKADVLSYQTGNNQTAFGVMLRDHVLVDQNMPSGTWTDRNGKSRNYSENFVAVGNLRFDATAAGVANPLLKVFARSDASQMGTSDSLLRATNPDTPPAINFPQFAMENYQLPIPGEPIPLTMKKMGNYVELTFGDETPVILDVTDVFKSAVLRDGAPPAGRTGNLFTNDTLYAGLFVARQASIMYYDTVLTKYEEPVSIQISRRPDRDKFVLWTNFDETGLLVDATYADGSKRTLEPEEYIISGYNSDALGNVTLTVNAGNSATASFDVEIVEAAAETLTVVSRPATTSYYIGDAFESEGMQVRVDYNSGITRMITPDAYELFIDGSPFYEGYVFDTPGEKTVTVKYIPPAGVKGEPESTFKLNVSEKPIKEVRMYRAPAKLTYYLNEEPDYTGMLMQAVYEGSNGNDEAVILKNGEDIVGLTTAEYTITGFDTSKVGTMTLTITYKGKTFSFDVPVKQRIPLSVQLTKYPKTTYAVGEELDLSDAVYVIVYDSGDKVPTTDYSVDSSAYNKNVKGTYELKFNYTGTVSSFDTITIKVTVRDQKDPKWKAAIFGQSASGTTPGVTVPNVGVYEKDGGERINVRSWNGAGKITGDHDGIAYYFTKIPTSDNFIVTADVTVNQFMQYSDDGRRHGQEAFGIMARDAVPSPYRLDGNGTELTIYEDEAGNEVDVYQKDAEGYAVIGTDGKPVFTEEAAAKIADGTYDKRYSHSRMGSDWNGNYSATTVFASNMVIAGAHPGSSFPGDPSAVTFKRNSTKNRIGLEIRKGVSFPADGGTLVGLYKSNTMALMDLEEPASGWAPADRRATGGTFTDIQTNGNSGEGVGGEPDVYRITLQKTNSGFTSWSTLLDSEGNENYRGVEPYPTSIYEPSILSVQDAEYMYVGFFAARWADIDVTNFSVTTSDARTDAPLDEGLKMPTEPNFTVRSLYYTPYTNYNLMLKSNCAGFFTIVQDGQVIKRDLKTGGELMTIPTVLNENSTAKFSVTFTPDPLENLTDYSRLISSFDVIHQEITSAPEVYVSPTGTQNAAGTYEDPIDLDTAVAFIKPGQKIIAKNGTYRRNGKNIAIHEFNRGNSEQMKYLWAETPGGVIIDLQKQGEGIILSGSYWHIKGIIVTRSGDNAKPFHIGGKNNIIERVTSHTNGDSGIQISRTGSSDIFTDWPSDNLLLNCESYSNRDASDTNADGFAIKLTVGNGNVLRGCIARNNIDDGYDLYTKIATGPIGAVVMENCMAYRNGYILDALGQEVEGSGDKNGFKIGGENVPVKHVLRESLTFNNGKAGVSSNSNPTGIVQNVISINNDTANLNLYSENKTHGFRYTVDGFVSYRDENVNRGFDPTVYAKDNFGMPAFSDAFNTIKENNYFIHERSGEPKNSEGEVVTADFFKSTVMPSGVIVYPRDEDGNIIFGDMYMLKSGWLYTPSPTAEPGPEPTPRPGGSGGVGNSGGGGGGAPVTPTDPKAPVDTPPDTSDSGAPVVEKVVTEKTVTADEFKALLDAAEDAANVVVTVSSTDEKANSFEAKLPAEAVTNSDKGLTVEVPGASVQFPAGLISASSIKEDSVVTIEVNKAEVIDVNSDLRAEFNTNMISVKVLIDGREHKIANLKAPIVITSDFSGSVKEAHKVVVYYINPDNGKEVVKNGFYDVVTNKVRFKTTHLSTFAFEESAKTFEDIQGAWSKEYVELLAVRGIINGTTPNTFSPNSEITRADFVKILVGVLDQVDTSGGGFSDISGNDYYYNEVLTAKTLGLVSGLTATTFGPREKITRQDMMVIIDKTLGYMGVTLTAKDDLANFADANQVSGYALESVQKLVAAGVISGNSGMINPKATLTRAEAAKVLSEVFLQSIS